MRFVERAPWMILVPSVVLSLAVLSFSLLGDALRDHLDPRLRHAPAGRASKRWWRRWRPPAGLAPSLARAAERLEDPSGERPEPSPR